MFYKLIERKCNEWFLSDDCTVKHIIEYMVNEGQMRDVQIEAIKIYLFLKIVGQSRPLSNLFKEGFFNCTCIDELEVSQTTREYLKKHSEAVALLEYASLKNEKGEQVSEKLEKQIKREPESIDYNRFFDEVFYGVSYTDYLFSLPMGAGKTYLMAAFIYLDLYFAMNEPKNPIFAHNFIVFAPSGLKSSVVPSLKTIQRFNPTWVIPEPAASRIKKLLIFEVLDQDKAKSKSNKTKNPNVQKVANHQPLSELFGLVVVTNAEKVILDRIQEQDGQLSFLEESDDEKDRQANELRNMLGKLPYLSIFIDEVHHAVSDEIKLRAVINRWMENCTINSVVGFSGTPFLDKAEKIHVIGDMWIGTDEITNIVYYYPLVSGVGNFLKKPIVKIESNSSSKTIIENGVADFLDTYKDVIYEDGTVAKLGIYCAGIERLEEEIYPIVSAVASRYEITSEQILKFHRGNRNYPQPMDSQMQFDMLDSPVSKIRIVLLVQIGKEGWDCRSLTGIILSQEGACPNNMVLQTSCRCLRQVVKNKAETALIYLNESNANKLNKQLMQQHHISVKEFQNADNKKILIKRYNRMDKLNIPPIEYYQLRIKYETLIVDKTNTQESISIASQNAYIGGSIIRTTDLSMAEGERKIDDSEKGKENTTFYLWLQNISKKGLGSPSIKELLVYEENLQEIYEKITYKKEGTHYFSSKYNIKQINANIRKSFFDKRMFKSTEELIPEQADLLNIGNFSPEVKTENKSAYFPDCVTVEKIIESDSGKKKLDKKTQKLIELARETGNTKIVDSIMAEYSESYYHQDRSFHYLPYRTDSIFEQIFLKEILSLEDMEKFGLEIYYNGDDSLTHFKIKCYKKMSEKWNYIGMYTPDFLIIQRKEDKIYKIIIIETKGALYATVPTFMAKKEFMTEYFIETNNREFGYQRFMYLYLEDTLSEQQRIIATHEAVVNFFAGGKQ